MFFKKINVLLIFFVCYIEMKTPTEAAKAQQLVLLWSWIFVYMLIF